MATATITRKPIFEYKDCSRCGGSGRYSYCQMYGDRCFRCKGKGTELTKRGAAAQAYCLELLTVTPMELHVGDKILNECIFANSPISIVTEEPILSDHSVTIKTDNLTLNYETTSRIVRRTLENVVIAREQALAYQATLTQAGTVKKCKAKIAA